MTSDLYLGDEVYHYRFAKDIYQAGKRVAFDPIYSTGNPPGYFYNSEPLWNGLLAILWRLVGNISFPVAQIYHTFYYVLLILLTYLLGIQLYGKKEGIYAALLISSVPMVISFSILFYLDIPGTTFAALSLLLFLKKRYFLTGLAISLIYFTRRNACFLVPGFLVALYLFNNDKFFLKLKNLCFLILPPGILGFIDLRWRYVHFESVKDIMTGGEIATVSTSDYLLDYIKARMARFLWGSGEYLNSSFMDPKDIFKYFGIALLFGLFLYFSFKKEKKKDLPILICLMGYLLCYAYFFGISSDIRYLLPIVPLLCVIVSSSFKYIKRLRWIKAVIPIICLIQLLGTSFYVHEKRRMPQEVKEAFSFIRQNTSVESLFMYPEYIFVEGTGRRFIWSSFFPIDFLAMRKMNPKLNPSDINDLLFWRKDQKGIFYSLQLNKVDYIVIKKTRIYDDSKTKHLGGYPKSFVERLYEFDFVRLVFENKEIMLWKIKGI